MEKLDLGKADKTYYAASPEPSLVEFGTLPYLTLQGQGAPGGAEFTDKVAALIPLAYGMKKRTKQQGRDFVVPKLEAIWWVTEEKEAELVPRSEWRWKLLIRMPMFAEEGDFAEVVQQVWESKGNAFVRDARYETFCEGLCVQLLHTGAYEAEEPSIAKIRSFMDRQRLAINGAHHEIYLSDPRKTETAKLKTIIRQPVVKSE